MAIKEWKKSYVEKVQESKSIHNEIREKIKKKKESIRRAEKSIEKLNEKYANASYPSWVDEMLIPLAQYFAKEFNLLYSIYDPFGLRAETTIYWLQHPDDSIDKQPVKKLTVIPHDLEKGELFYQTGNQTKSERFAKGSLGEINGMNNETLPLPENLEEIKTLIK